MTATRIPDDSIRSCVLKTCSPGEFWIALYFDLPSVTEKLFVEELNLHVARCLKRREKNISYEPGVPEIGQLIAVKFEGASNGRAAVCSAICNDPKGLNPEVIFLDSCTMSRITLFDYENFGEEVVVNCRLKRFCLYNVLPVNNEASLPWHIDSYRLVKKLVQSAKEFYVVPVHEERSKGIGRMFGYLYLNIMGEIKDLRKILLEKRYCVEDESAFCRFHELDENFKKEATPLTPCLVRKSTVPPSCASCGSSSPRTQSNSPQIQLDSPCSSQSRRSSASSSSSQTYSKNQIISGYKAWGQEPLSEKDTEWIIEKSEQENNIYFSKGRRNSENRERQGKFDDSEDCVSDTFSSEIENNASKSCETMLTLQLIENIKRQMNIRPDLDVLTWLELEKSKGGNSAIVCGPRTYFLSHFDWEAQERLRLAESRVVKVSTFQEAEKGYGPFSGEVRGQIRRRRRTSGAEKNMGTSPREEIMSQPDDPQTQKTEERHKQAAKYSKEEERETTSAPRKSKLFQESLENNEKYEALNHEKAVSSSSTSNASKEKEKTKYKSLHPKAGLKTALLQSFSNNESHHKDHLSVHGISHAGKQVNEFRSELSTNEGFNAGKQVNELRCEIPVKGGFIAGKEGSGFRSESSGSNTRLNDLLLQSINNSETLREKNQLGANGVFNAGEEVDHFRSTSSVNGASNPTEQVTEYRSELSVNVGFNSGKVVDGFRSESSGSNTKLKELLLQSIDDSVSRQVKSPSGVKGALNACKGVDELRSTSSINVSKQVNEFGSKSSVKRASNAIEQVNKFRSELSGNGTSNAREQVNEFRSELSVNEGVHTDRDGLRCEASGSKRKPKTLLVQSLDNSESHKVKSKSGVSGAFNTSEQVGILRSELSSNGGVKTGKEADGFRSESSGSKIKLKELLLQSLDNSVSHLVKSQSGVKGALNACKGVDELRCASSVTEASNATERVSKFRSELSVNETSNAGEEVDGLRRASSGSKTRLQELLLQSFNDNEYCESTQLKMTGRSHSSRKHYVNGRSMPTSRRFSKKH